MWKQMARELAASTGEDPEAAARMIEEEMWRVVKIAEEARAGRRQAVRELA
jgi:hydrogenase expression/formation protein HypC